MTIFFYIRIDAFSLCVKEMSKTTLVRVDPDLLEKYREQHAELKGLTYTAIVEVMLRKALEKEAS